MSLSSFKNTKGMSRQYLRASAQAQDLLLEVKEYLEECLLHTTSHLTQSEAESLVVTYQTSYWEGGYSDGKNVFLFGGKKYTSTTEVIEVLKQSGKSRGAIYIASRILSGAEPDLKQLTQDWFAHRNIKATLSKEELDEIDASPSKLRYLGIKHSWEARAFYELYKEVRVKTRPWGSCYQVNKNVVLKIALTPNFKKLPLWVKKGLVDHAPWDVINTDRVGNIWRLIPCVKAWKWETHLPKGIAEKIGNSSLKLRMLSSWAAVDCVYWFCGYKFNKEKFWENLSKMQKMSLSELINTQIFPDWDRLKWSTFLTFYLNLPQGLVDLPKEVTKGSLLEAIEKFGSAEQYCQVYLGCKGKKTLALFSKSNINNIQWAASLAFGQEDYVQQILSLPASGLIGYEEEVIEFLLSLPMGSRIRLLQSKTFKYRGEIHDITNDHIRDTGYLWKHIENKPNLGRIRCWFSVHEQLAAAFVKELPDEALPIPSGWERLDGLCAVDGSWELEFPRRVATLKYWGQTQHNCVGGYGPAIKSGRSVIFVVREYGQITHTVEYCEGRCNQFYKAGNSSPDYEVKASVTEAIAQAFS